MGMRRIGTCGDRLNVAALTGDKRAAAAAALRKSFDEYLGTRANFAFEPACFTPISVEIIC